MEQAIKLRLSQNIEKELTENQVKEMVQDIRDRLAQNIETEIKESRPTQSSLAEVEDEDDEEESKNFER
tara:strand:- start:242 stop:448 length:207 start_codon:yes stop_codon:yes gene_type:complete